MEQEKILDRRRADEMKLLKLRAVHEELQARYTAEHPEIRNLDGKIAELEAVMAAARLQEPAALRTSRQELDIQLGEVERKLRDSEQDRMKAELAELRAKLEAMRQLAGGGRGNPLVGRTLKVISSPGLSDSVRSDLLSRLPVREGDILSAQTLEQTGVAVRSYDEHLTVKFFAADDGSAELRINAPGEDRR